MNILNKTISKSTLRNKKLLENMTRGISLINFSQKNLFNKININNNSIININFNNKEKVNNTLNKISKFNFSKRKLKIKKKLNQKINKKYLIKSILMLNYIKFNLI